MRKILMVVFLVLAASARAGQLSAQVRSPGQIRSGDSTLVADTIPQEGPSARGAFARALILPGWGHYSIGAYRRGTVFVALEGTSWFMLVKTMVKLNRAQDHNTIFEAQARDSLNDLMASDTAQARRLSDEQVFADAITADPDVIGGRALVGSRKEQRQDWITYTLFFTMASAVDAYVAANLRDFPVEVSAVPRRDGAVALTFRMPTGKRIR